MHDYVAFLQARKIKQFLWFNLPPERARKGLACPLRIFCLVPERKDFLFSIHASFIDQAFRPLAKF